MRNNVRFSSARFPHDSDLDRGADAAQLGAWILGRLRGDARTVSEPIEEDWGCLLQVQDESSRFHIGCGHVEDSTWLIFVDSVPGWRAKLFGGNASDSAQEDLCRIVDEALRSDPLISGIEWFSVDRKTGQELDHSPHRVGSA